MGRAARHATTGRRARTEAGEEGQVHPDDVIGSSTIFPNDARDSSAWWPSAAAARGRVRETSIESAPDATTSTRAHLASPHRAGASSRRRLKAPTRVERAYSASTSIGGTGPLASPKKM